MCSFTLFFDNCNATRMAFCMALESDLPWHIIQIPLTPNKGTPPYSLKSILALNASKVGLHNHKPVLEEVFGFAGNVCSDINNQTYSVSGGNSNGNTGTPYPFQGS